MNLGETLKNGTDDDGNGHTDDAYGHNPADDNVTPAFYCYGIYAVGITGVINNNEIGTSSTVGGNGIFGSGAKSTSR